jgi:ArsR family transcriptional regulator, zinc-responsive transcriptional repressor
MYRDMEMYRYMDAMVERDSADELVPMDMLQEAADCLKVMAHPIRLRIVDILMKGDYSVREIAGICQMPEHQICEHLRLMQGCRLLTSERRGRTVHYKVVAYHLPSLLECIKSSGQGNR